jgi:hypothetical protein
MQAVDVVNRLKEVVGNYNDDFVDLVDISSLTRSGTTITATTATSHNLNTGDYITVRGAVNPITIINMVRVDDIVTVDTATATQLVDPSFYSVTEAPKLTVTISGVDPVEYNGTFQLLQVSDDRKTFTYKIDSTPSSVITNGFFLQPDYDGYNGYKQVTVTGPTSFTYEGPDNLQTPAQGTIQMVTATRVAWAATRERVDQYLEGDENRKLQNWLYVVLGAEVVYKDGTVASDPESSIKANEDYYYEPYQDISVYLFLPSQDDILGGFSSDKARELRSLIVKAIGNFTFNSDLVEKKYQPAIYIGNEEDDYTGAVYVHRYDFAAQGSVQPEDTIDLPPGVPLELIDGTIEGKDLSYTPRYRV